MGYITSESQLIDVATINSGCDTIASAGIAFNECATEVESAADMCGVEVLSVEKKSMQPIIYELSDQIRQINGILESFANSIRGVASEIYAAQYAPLQEYRASLEKNKNPVVSEEE